LFVVSAAIYITSITVVVVVVRDGKL